MEYVAASGLLIAHPLYRFVEGEAIPGSGISSENFWASLAQLICDNTRRNASLMAFRDRLQARIDEYHRTHTRDGAGEYKAFLREIGYVLPEPAPFEIGTSDVDDEISRIAGPQLVVPLSNARYALNAVNARWGSLYDALYGTDALAPKGASDAAHDPLRREQVVARTKEWLDDFVPLQSGKYEDAIAFAIEDGVLIVSKSGGFTGLTDPTQFVGYQGAPENPRSVLLRHNDLHIELVIDREQFVGRNDPAGICDLVLESALSTIMDMEDSVASVDADDKVGIYRNWLRLVRGTLTATFDKAGRPVERRMNEDRQYTAPGGGARLLPGRSLMLARHVGLHMYTDAVKDQNGRNTPEGLLDLMITTLIARHDRQAALRNSRAGSVYIVKPKMHGPEEVRFVVDTFAQAEACLGFPANTLKIGIMDEERRTSVNLMACIEAAAERVFFINTGFLDRTGDEIHTVMEAGPVVRKFEMKSAAWLAAYEDSNVDIGLRVGLSGRAQIGKGMWAAPDDMADMMKQKSGHPNAGASTAWVPSPTSATLHALHYHMVDVRTRRQEIALRPRTHIDAMLALPLQSGQYTSAEIEAELDNNLQSILGYVVRWVDQGVGCSKVPDINGMALMEDRATLRISSQHVANWLKHGLIGEAYARDHLKHVAVIVDDQNKMDPQYRSMAPAFDGPAFRAACDLVFEGAVQPNGYTEGILHRYRREAKAASGA